MIQQSWLCYWLRQVPFIAHDNDPVPAVGLSMGLGDQWHLWLCVCQHCKSKLASAIKTKLATATWHAMMSRSQDYQKRLQANITRYVFQLWCAINHKHFWGPLIQQQNSTRDYSDATASNWNTSTHSRPWRVTLYKDQQSNQRMGVF